MSQWRVWLGWAMLAVSSSWGHAQTPAPVLGNIAAPYASVQSTVKIAGVTWGAGAVSYGPVGTPLVLSGENLGGEGLVQFVPYKNGVVDTSATAVQATVTLWTSNMLILTVPSGALTGMVRVTVEGKTSNGLPFLVVPGQYAASCPAAPSGTQLQITTSSLHDGAVGQSYSATLIAMGGTGAYTWSIASGSLPAGLSLNASTGAITGTPTAATGSNPSPVTFQVTDSDSPHQNDQAEVSLTIEPQTMTSGSIYSYSVGYDGVGNVTSFHDATYNNGSGIMGSWTYTPDTLNRLATATVTWPNGAQQYACWSYDSFGNRLQQEISGASFQSGSGGANSCNAQPSAWLETDLNSFTVNGSDPGNNRVQSTNARGVTATLSYDVSGNLLNDGVNQYLYDGEGRVCAVQSTVIPGMTSITGYLYDADGNRVAKGSITSMSCDLTANGFQFNGNTENYVLGPNGEELTTLDGNNWQRTNVYAGGELIGTYDLVTNPANPAAQIPWLHFHLSDPLGTRRMQVSGMLANLGQPETDFQSLPFGDQLASYPDPYADATANDATPLHFTGKERDTESGNDYFDARYYSSTMGRFLSPDWSAKEEPVPYAKLDNPQTLNLYSYVQNNPLARTDPDGHEECCDITADELRAAFATAGAIISAPEAALAGVAAGAVVAAGYSAAQGNSPYLSNGYPTSFNLNPTSSNASPSPNASSPQASGQQSTPAQPPDGGGKYDNSKDNQERMVQGKAPVGNDGKPVELHHEGQSATGELKEMTQTEHRGGSNFAKNHPNTGQEPSKIDRNQFKQQRQQYWKDKAKQNQNQ